MILGVFENNLKHMQLPRASIIIECLSADTVVLKEKALAPCLDSL